MAHLRCWSPPARAAGSLLMQSCATSGMTVTAVTRRPLSRTTRPIFSKLPGSPPKIGISIPSKPARLISAKMGKCSSVIRVDQKSMLNPSSTYSSLYLYGRPSLSSVLERREERGQRYGHPRYAPDKRLTIERLARVRRHRIDEEYAVKICRGDRDEHDHEERQRHDQAGATTATARSSPRLDRAGKRLLARPAKTTSAQPTPNSARLNGWNISASARMPIPMTPHSRRRAITELLPPGVLLRGGHFVAHVRTALPESSNTCVSRASVRRLSALRLHPDLARHDHA